jgi:riboflavin biosynthesis pyrimidine reductase
MEPLQLLATGGAAPPNWGLPSELERLYGGPLGFEVPRTITNFVQSVDGVVAIPALQRSNALIAGQSEADHFVIGLLRACADVVLLGSGTLRSSPHGTWRADDAYPAAAAAFRELRRNRGLPEHPAVVIVSAGGSLDATHPALQRGALVLTTSRAAPALASSLPPATELIAVNDGDAVDLSLALALLRERGHALILSEGGPTLFGSLLTSRSVDELFLTVSPLLAGRTAAPRLALVEGVELLPEHVIETSLVSAHRASAYLFLRYSLT